MAIANVANTNTVEEWRVIVNQMIVAQNRLLEQNGLLTGNLTINPSNTTSVSLNVANGFIAGNGSGLTALQNTAIVGILTNSQLQNTGFSVSTSNGIVSLYATANTGNSLNLSLTIVDSLANTRNNLTISANMGNVLNQSIISAFNQANTGVTNAALASGTAAAAYGQANTGVTNAALASGTAAAAFTKANSGTTVVDSLSNTRTDVAGSANAVNTLNSLILTNNVGRLLRETVITSNTTYTRFAGNLTRKFEFTVISGGGGGGSANTGCGGAGGSGSFIRFTCNEVMVSEPLTITFGGLGTGGSTYANGAQGSSVILSTIFVTDLTLTGGKGGERTQNTFVVAGAADTRIGGAGGLMYNIPPNGYNPILLESIIVANGQFGSNSSYYNTSDGQRLFLIGAGGQMTGSFGGPPNAKYITIISTSVSGNGANGTGYGHGGQGGYSSNGTVTGNKSGSDGMPGIVIIKEYT